MLITAKNFKYMSIRIDPKNAVYILEANIPNVLG